MVKARSEEQIESGEALDTNIIAATVPQHLSTPHDQLAGDASVVEGLPLGFDSEIVTASIPSRRDVLEEIVGPPGERLGILRESDGDSYGCEIALRCARNGVA